MEGHRSRPTTSSISFWTRAIQDDKNDTTWHMYQITTYQRIPALILHFLPQVILFGAMCLQCLKQKHTKWFKSHIWPWISWCFIISSRLWLSVEEVVSVPALNIVHVEPNKLLKWNSVLGLCFSYKRDLFLVIFFCLQKYATPWNMSTMVLKWSIWESFYSYFSSL